MRLLSLLPIIATLILAAPASASNIVHNGPNVDFTVQPTGTVDLTVTGQPLNSPGGATFTRAPGTTPLTIGAGCSINTVTNVGRCGVGPGGAYRFTTADRADKIDASGTQLPF